MFSLELLIESSEQSLKELVLFLFNFLSGGWDWEGVGKGDHFNQSQGNRSHAGLEPCKVLLNVLLVLILVQLIFYSLLAVADVVEHNLTASQDLVASISDHGNGASRVDGQICLCLMLSFQSVHFLECVLHSGYIKESDDSAGLTAQVVSPQHVLALTWSFQSGTSLLAS